MTDTEAVAAYLAAFCRRCGHGPHPGRSCVVVSVRPSESVVPVEAESNGHELHPGCDVVECECEEYLS